MKKISFLLAEIHDFTSKEAQQLLHNKFVVVIGDSNYRAIYKDLVYFLQTDELIPVAELKEKHEDNFSNDCLLELNKSQSKNDYHLVRQYRTSHHLVRFYFITRAYSSYVESILNDFRAALAADLAPDVVILHSCLWDLNRYHEALPTEPPVPKAIREYRQNVEKLFQALDEVLPSSTLIIWNTAMAITEDARGYVIEQPCKVSAQDMIEANFYSTNLARGFWFDVLDLHYYFRFLQDFHSLDGIHWNFRAHRYLTKLLLTHLAEAWQVQLQKQRPLMDIPKYPKAQSRRNVNLTSPQLIPTLWTNSSARDFFSSRRPSHLRRNAHKKRLRARLGPYYHSPVQLGGPEDALHQERNPLSSAALSDFTGLERRPISTSEGPQSLLGYDPRGPERGGYDWWPVASTEQEHGPQLGPNFNSHAPHLMSYDSWPILPSLEGVQCLPYYDGRSRDPFHAGYDATTPISRQEYRPQPNAGYSSVPDSRTLHCVEQGVQFYSDPYIPPIQDDRLSRFAPQGSRFHPNSLSYFPQGAGDASRRLNTVEPGQGLQPHHYFPAALRSDDDSWVTGLLESPAHHNVRSGPWPTGGGEGDPGFPSHAEEIHLRGFSGSEFFTHEERWAPYSLPR